MAKNQESINRSLFELLRSRGYEPTLLDTSGKEIPVPEEAEVFQFKFTKDGEEYGTVTASIDGLHKLVIYFGDDVANSEKESTGGDESWYKLLNHLKRFAQQHQLSFEVKNTDHLKYDMAKRDHMKKQERISEGYYPMGKKGSYSDAVPTTKIIIQHNKNIEEGEQRYRNVAKIFVENSEGERFAVPTTKPGIARVYARHIAEGGTPYDEKGKHITSLCEEYQKMGAFVRATRNGQFNESAQRLVNEGINHYQSLRETLGRMTGHRGYTAYFESWTPPLMEDETDTSNLNELFVQETLDPRIESVMPILSKLHKKVAEMKEVGALSEWADSLTEAPGAETLAHNVKTDKENLDSLDLDEALDPEKKERLGSLIDLYTDATDPEYMGDDDYEDIIAQIRAEFGDKTADSIANGPSMHFPRPGHSMGHDDLEFKQMRKTLSPNRINKAGKLHKQDNDAMKRDIKSKLGVEEGILDTVKKVGSKVFDKLGGGSEEDLLKDLKKRAGVRNPVNGKPSMAHSDVEKVDEVDMGQYDAVKTPLKGKDTSDWDKNFREKLKQYAKELEQRQKEKAEEVDESALQASFGYDKYGEDGMEALQDAGRKGASKKTMQNIRAEFSDKEKPVKEDGEFAGDYATGEAGQWRNKGPKANKPATIGDLVGENFINTDAQSVVSEMDKSEDKKGPEGQEDLDAILRIINR